MLSVLLLALVAGLNPVLGRGYRSWWLGYLSRVFVFLFVLTTLVVDPQTRWLDLLPLMIFSNLLVSVVNVAIERAATRRQLTPREAHGILRGILLGIVLLVFSVVLRVVFLHVD